MTETLFEKLATFIAPFGVPTNSFQRSAYEKLLHLDFPTTKNEYWKYTRLNKISNSKFQIPNFSGTIKSVEDKKNSINKLSEVTKSEIFSSHYLVIENGILREDLSQYENLFFSVTVLKNKSLEDHKLINTSIDQKNIFSALNTAFFSESIIITFLPKSNIDEPLQLIFISTGKNTISNPRILIHAQKSSQTKIAASYISLDSESSFTNSITEFFIDENATLVYDKIQNENASSFHISTEEVTQSKNSTFKLNTATLDGALVRNNINISVNGENCETHMNGIVISKGNQHIDNHTFVNHKVANCISNENYKYILEDRSTGVFNGRVIVQKDAQKINAYQKNANILLSDFAQIYSKPELEIYADDVKCSHGSTTGQLDEDAVFYLQARGISKAKAKKLLVSAFISDIVKEFSSEGQRTKIATVLREKHNWGN